MEIFKEFNSETVKILKNGGIGVIPTDTIYGIVGSALSRKTVARIYKLRKRNPRKPVIVLIASMLDLKKFGIKLNRGDRRILDELWPAPVSVILRLSDGKEKAKRFEYLHRGKNAVAFRLPRRKNLLRFLKNTGPLAAPSANLEGMPPAKTVKEARRYFGNKIDFYVNGGKLKSKPSALVSLKRGKVSIVRKGAGNFK
ncbi:MAG: threonylcarbamoyl-AMP synthase [Candidatus Liptonbacteria bacterium]|nr:threonylcarbamoyl-AMP synthase [Candidatus Liptonbacteria bacterium]